MERIYRSDKAFREALEASLEEIISTKRWDGMRLLFECAGIHLYYTENDLEDCLYILQQVGVINDKS